MSKLFPVILAGGGGTRLWPLSRELYPKQFLNLSGSATLLQETLARAEGIQKTGSNVVEVLPPTIICNEEHRFLVAEQARQWGKSVGPIMLEPVGRNTAPALTCAALLARKNQEDPVILMMPADHLIKDNLSFNLSVLDAMKIAERGHLVTFGIVPDKPETGYGYIHRGSPLVNLDITSDSPSSTKSYKINGFVEKPNLSVAQSYLESGDYYWNSGIFMMKSSIWLAAIQNYRPDILAACEKACEGSSDGEFFRVNAEAFKECPSDSIDYAVMEHVPKNDQFKSAVVPLMVGWSDVGSWSSLWDIAQHDDNGNYLKGDVCSIDAKNNLIMSEYRFVAALGCENLVIIETADAVMVTTRERSQDVKRIVEWLKSQKREERLAHRCVYRPWGSYEGVDEGERFQVKRITVKPGAKLSLQMHHHRAEHWIVVRGTAKVTCAEKEYLLTENQSTFIPLGVKHRLENPGSIPLELVEVQSGPYLGEDDIVRFQDIYNRS